MHKGSLSFPGLYPSSDLVQRRSLGHAWLASPSRSRRRVAWLRKRRITVMAKAEAQRAEKVCIEELQLWSLLLKDGSCVSPRSAMQLRSGAMNGLWSWTHGSGRSHILQKTPYSDCHSLVSQQWTRLELAGSVPRPDHLRAAGGPLKVYGAAMQLRLGHTTARPASLSGTLVTGIHE